MSLSHSDSEASFSQEFFSLNLKREEIEIKQEVQLGKGAYGSVYEGRCGAQLVCQSDCSPISYRHGNLGGQAAWPQGGGEGHHTEVGLAGRDGLGHTRFQE